MARSKEKNELEYLRAEVRGLKAQVRHLKKELSRKNKQTRVLESHFEIEPDAESGEEFEALAEPAGPDGPICPSCKKPGIRIVDIGIRHIEVCDICRYRKTTKK